MKIYDKARWQLEGGLNEKDILKHFVFMFEWLNKHNMLNELGKEILDIGIDITVSISDDLLNEDGKIFIKKYYDKYISKIDYGKIEDEKLLDNFYNNLIEK